MGTQNMLKKIRTICASVVFVLITALFLDFTGTIHAYLGWLAKIQFLPAVLSLNILALIPILLITLTFGRIYCSIICPLGVFQDGISHMAGKKKKNRFHFHKANKLLRYSILSLFLLAIIFGVGSFLALLAPYSAYGRIVQNIFSPIYQAGNNLLALICERVDSYAFYSKEVWLRSLPTFITAVLSLVVVSVLAWKGGREYCNSACPVGTFLSFFARHSWFKIHIDEDKCVNCNLCAKNCKASCIDIKNHSIDYSRCVVCGDCIGKCRKSAISYSHLPEKTAGKTISSGKNIDKSAGGGKQPEGTDTGRRAFLIGTALATGQLAYSQEKKKVDGGLAVIEKKKAPKRQTPITPAGSLSAQNMATHCTGCQLCVSVCPNDVLRPSTGILTFMQPTMSYERGYCRPECNRCSTVCPAGAIRPISAEDKSSTQIGHAVWIRENCVPVSEGQRCGNCARHCPVGAISMVKLSPESNLRVPAINTSRCIGCGACENLCPSRPYSAIYVEGHEVHKTI